MCGNGSGKFITQEPIIHRQYVSSKPHRKLNNWGNCNLLFNLVETQPNIHYQISHTFHNPNTKPITQQTTTPNRQMHLLKAAHMLFKILRLTRYYL